MTRILGALVMGLLIGAAAPLVGQGSPYLIDAIRWQWPGAEAVVRGDALERWDGPMARPTDAQIAQAVSDYTAQRDTIKADAEAKQYLDQERLASAIVWAVIDTYSPPATKAQYAAARAKILNAYQTMPWR